MRELNAIFTIASRDITKFLRDRSRILATFIFPLIFIGVLGGGLHANLGQQVGYNFLTFVFTGVLAQTLFQSSAAGVISLIEDRTKDFSQEIFVSPVSRYSIIIGKILGESLVATVQALGIVIFGLIIGVPLSLKFLIIMIPAGLAICFLGGAFGILVLSNLNSERTANQIFPFIIFPQFFLAGVFNPIKDLPLYLAVFSKLAPMTYAVDFLRSFYYAGRPEYDKIVLSNSAVDMLIIGSLLALFLIIGTLIFVRNERNR